MLIRKAEIEGAIVDVRLRDGIVAAIAPALMPIAGENVVDARGAVLLPGLHDHHLHLNALAAALDSVHCGPPRVRDAQALGYELQTKAQALAASGDGWIRGIGYTDSVAGNIDRDWLDQFAPSIPVRVQHRSGRLWILNSCALQRIAEGLSKQERDASPLEQQAGRWTGRLYDADDWLRGRLRGNVPDLRRASALLASYGITGITEVTPHNNTASWRAFAAAHAGGAIIQDLCVMGDASLNHRGDEPGLRLGATKIHLHESHLPALDAMTRAIAISHDADRPVAIHCVTLTELLFSLAALAAAGAVRGDRIEHAAIAPPDALRLMREQGVTVVTQPNFIGERGDDYLRDVEAADRPWLYRARAFLDAGIPLAAGTDAPFGAPDPWRAMRDAVQRRTPRGAVLDAAETLTPEQALALFLGHPDHPGGPARRIATGASADLCLLDRPWRQARCDLASARVLATWKAGDIIYRAAEN